MNMVLSRAEGNRQSVLYDLQTTDEEFQYTMESRRI